MFLPNTVMVGAPKCGTSSVFTWLAAHPEVCGSSVKEPFYLVDRGFPKLKPDSNFHDHGLAGYSAYFAHCRPHHKIIVEATTHYMYQQTALEALSSLQPTPQIIFMLRKPAERIYSSFLYTQNNLANLDRRLTFAQFVTLLRSDSSELLWKHCANLQTAYIMTNEIRYSQYIDHITLWLKRFGPEHVHVFLFETMRRDPRGFMTRLAERLGIDPTFYQHYSFQRQNDTFFVRNQLLHREARSFSRLIPRNSLKRLLKNIYLSVQKARKTAATLEDQAALLLLDNHFRPFNQQLAANLKISLADWEH